MDNQPQLSLTDIIDATKIIGAVLERGGVFNAEEIIGISSVYKNLKEFSDTQAAILKAAQEQQEQNQFVETHNTATSTEPTPE